MQQKEEVENIVLTFFSRYLNQTVSTFNLLTAGERGVPLACDNDTMLTVYHAPAKWLRMALYGAGLVEAEADEINTICMEMADMLFLLPGMQLPDVPISWYETPLGALWTKALVRSLGDELIPIAEAARIAGVSPQAISQRIAAGKLSAYTDPDAPSRQGRRLVRKSKVQEAA